MRANAWCGVLSLAIVVACGGGGGGGGGSSKPALPPPVDLPPPTGVAVVPNDATGPVGVTWRIAFPENVSRAELEAWYARMVALTADLWNVSEGQVYVAHVVIADALKPGYTADDLASGIAPPQSDVLDMLVFTGAGWDVPAGGIRDLRRGDRSRRSHDRAAVRCRRPADRARSVAHALHAVVGAGAVALR